MRARLAKSHPDLAFTFDFVDGPLSSAPAPDIPLFYPAPYYAFYADPSIPSIRAAHVWLQELLSSRGPYDGILAFSQGCALVSSFLLYQQWYDCEAPAPFRFAMFICGGVPIPVLKDLGVPVPRRVEDLDALTKSQLLDKTTAAVTRDRWTPTEYAAIVRRAQFDSEDCFGLDLNKVPLELKLRIPTAHVFGERDPRLPASVQLAGLCDAYLRKVYGHASGHEIPRNDEVSGELAELLAWCARRASWPGMNETR